jgi:hypothetical protein
MKNDRESILGVYVEKETNERIIREKELIERP